MPRWLVAILATGLLSACASFPTNAPLVSELEKTDGYDFSNWLATRKESKSGTLVVLSFSGGGIRAAALAASVLTALEKHDLTNDIAIISSTSGGSVTAAHFAAKGIGKLGELNKHFLFHENTASLFTRLAPAFITGANRSLLFADYLDEQLFQAIKYKDLRDRWRNGAPFVVLNASDMSSGRTLEFTQEGFSYLCSDLSSFSVSSAVAASAAVPFVMSPVTLKNHWGDGRCAVGEKVAAKRDEQYRSALNNRDRRLGEFRNARYVHSLQHTFKADPEYPPYRQIEYVHLLDGGLSDNLAARALLRTFTADTMTRLKESGIQRILLVQVNAKSDDHRDIDHSPATPSWVDVMKSAALNPIDITTALSEYISNEYWVRLIEYVNYPDAGKAAGSGKNIAFFPVQIDFDLLAPGSPDQERAKKIPTDWSLPPDDVRFLEDMAPPMLAAHSCFKAFLLHANGSKATAEAVPNCTLIDVAHKGDVVAQIPTPAPAYAVPPPPPAASAPRPPPPAPVAAKVTMAADALFDFDKAEIKPDARRRLDELAEQVRRVDLEVVIAIGHTDSIGTDAYNLKLSVRRAGSIKAYLVSRGVQPNRIFTEGKGSKQPVASNASPEGRARNRRVDIEVVGTRK